MKSFPPFRLDTANQCLWRGEERISLAPKVFSVLCYLVERSGRLVTQDEILDGLWKDTFVQPEVLRKYILEIRRALDDPPKAPRFLVTYPKRGYEFIAKVTDEGDPPAASLEAEPAIGMNLAGRSRTVEELRRCLGLTLRGQRQLVFLTGEPGIGKTALADGFQRDCESRPGLAVARGQCLESFGGKEAYYPVLDALGPWMRGPQRDAAVDSLERLAPTWLAQFPGAIKPERRESLQREILGATRERMVREFCEVVEFWASQRPLVLILEDLHWADSSTLDLISALGRRRVNAKLMLVCTYRPVEVILTGSPLRRLKQDLLVHRLCREIALERLTESEVEEYLAGRFPDSGGLPRLLSGLIHRRSDGNPLFMVALAEQLVEKGLIREDRGHWVSSARSLEAEVPETLRQMLESQIEQLAEEEARLLRAASVVGPRFSAWAVASALGSDFAGVEEVCEGLARRQQMVRRIDLQELPGGFVSAQYAFRHVLYRDLLYAQLPASQCRHFHLEIASAMEGLANDAGSSLAAELASHFQAGHNYPRAIQYLILTAGNAARRYAHSESVALLRQALELLPHLPPEDRGPEEVRILERISDALYAHGEMEQSGEVDQKVAELAAQTGLKAAQVNAMTRLARALAFRDPDRCITVCERALEVSRTHGDPLLEARAEMLAASWRIVTNGWSSRDARIGQAARDRIRGLSNDVPEYYEILYAHAECIEGRYEDACRTAQAGISSSLETDNLVVYLSAHSSLAQALLHLGRWGEELRIIAAAQGVVEKNGNAPWRGIFQALLAWLKFQACDFQGSTKLAETLLASHTEQPAGQVRTMALVTLGYTLLATGAPDRSAVVFANVCDRELRPRFFLDWYWKMYAQLGLSHALLAMGRDSEAEMESARFVDTVAAGADPALKAGAGRLEASLAIRRQDWDRAWECLNRSFAALHSHPVPPATWRMHATAFELHSRTGDEAAAAHHRARAAAILLDLAHSMPPEEPLRAALLRSAPMRNMSGSSEVKLVAVE